MNLRKGARGPKEGVEVPEGEWLKRGMLVQLVRLSLQGAWQRPAQGGMADLTRGRPMPCIHLFALLIAMMNASVQTLYSACT